MSECQGFWSYVHADDEAEGGRIVRLANDVKIQFQMLTGDSIALFLDKDAIEWGEDWRKKIDSSLASIAFFIPVMTPRYFMSAECRRELRFFAQRATRLGIKELVLPLLYVDVPSLRDETTTDDLIELVRTFQWEDWTELRFEDVDTGAYRKAVSRLVKRLVEANRHAEEVDVLGAAKQLEEAFEEGGDDSPGLLDRLAKAEETLPRWVENLEAIGRDIEIIGQVMRKATADINQGTGKGFSARLVVARRVARELQEPTERVWSSGNQFASQLHDVDEGFRAMIEKAPAQIEQNSNSKSDVCAFFEAVRGMSAAARDGLQAVQVMIDTIAPIEKMSRDLRPALRRMRQGLTIMLEAREVTEEWVRLIETSGVECPGVSAQTN